MLHVSIPHCMPEKNSETSKTDNSCLFVWRTVPPSVHVKAIRDILRSRAVVELRVPILETGTSLIGERLPFPDGSPTTESRQV